jgi:hypothetical protein
LGKQYKEKIMEALTVTLGLKLFFIAACLFAPEGKRPFEVECYENGKKVFTLYAQQNEKGYSLYSGKDRKGKPMIIVESGNKFTIDKGKKASVIDNSKVNITPLRQDGSYKRTIGNAEVIFEYKQNVRKIYQDHSDKYFIVKGVAQTDTRDKQPMQAASQQSCVSNLKLIHNAKDAYSMAKSLGKGAVVSADQISFYIKGGFESRVCPEGGKYSICPVGEKPNCSLKIHSQD